MSAKNNVVRNNEFLMFVWEVDSLLVAALATFFSEDNMNNNQYVSVSEFADKNRDCKIRVINGLLSSIKSYEDRDLRSYAHNMIVASVDDLKDAVKEAIDRAQHYFLFVDSDIDKAKEVGTEVREWFRTINPFEDAK